MIDQPETSEHPAETTAQFLDNNLATSSRPRTSESPEEIASASAAVGGAAPISGARRTAYWVVFGLLALSLVGLGVVHLHPSSGHNATGALATTTTTSHVRATTTSTTTPIPSGLKPGAEAAATALVSSWASGDRAAALTVATPSAVSTLFSNPYSSGNAIDRGCSTSFSPIVCTFGPPGGASPTDPIFEIDVTQTAGGWYVSSVKKQN